MTFIPANFKYKKQFKGKISNQLFKNLSPSPLKVGTFGLKALESSFLTSKNFETIKQTVRKIIKKTGRIIFNCFPHIPKTKKPLEIRMGKGKGNVDSWIFKIKPGFIIFEINTLNTAIAVKALKAAQYKLPLRTKLIFDN